MQTTPKSENAFDIENKNDETVNAYLTQKLSPQSQERIKAGRCREFYCGERITSGSCISNSVKLEIIAEESENDKGHLSCLPLTTAGTTAITSTNEESTPLDGDVDMHVHQKSVSGKFTGMKLLIQ